MTRTDPSLRASVKKWSLIIGSIGLVAGVVGPTLFSDSNLGPLLGYFFTGPVGVLCGALWGTVSWALHADSAREAILWIVGIWTITLLYTFVMIRMTPGFALFGICAQLLILFASVFLLYRHDTRSRLPRIVRACGPIAISVMAVVILATLYPPVTQPWWGPAEGRLPSASLPVVAYLLNPAFDASRHIPKFAVNSPVLFLEWIATILAGGVSCYFVARHRGHVEPLESGS